RADAGQGRRVRDGAARGADIAEGAAGPGAPDARTLVARPAKTGRTGGVERDAGSGRGPAQGLLRASPGHEVRPCNRGARRPRTANGYSTRISSSSTGNVGTVKY